MKWSHAIALIEVTSGAARNVEEPAFASTTNPVATIVATLESAFTSGVITPATNAKEVGFANTTSTSRIAKSVRRFRTILSASTTIIVERYGAVIFVITHNSPSVTA